MNLRNHVRLCRAGGEDFILHFVAVSFPLYATVGLCAHGTLLYGCYYFTLGL